MNKKDDKVTRCDVRIPNDVYGQIEALAVANGAGNHHRSHKPIVTPTILDLLQIGLAHYDKPLSDKVPDTNLMDEKIQAAIAPILARLEKLEQQPNPAAIIPNEAELEPLPILEAIEATESVETVKPPKPTPKIITGDLRKGLSQSEFIEYIKNPPFNIQTKLGVTSGWAGKRGLPKAGENKILSEYFEVRNGLFYRIKD